MTLQTDIKRVRDAIDPDPGARRPFTVSDLLALEEAEKRGPEALAAFWREVDPASLEEITRLILEDDGGASTDAEQERP